MTDILEFALFILTVYLTLRIASLIISRVRAVRKIRSLIKMTGAEVTFSPTLLLSYFRISKSPDATVTVGNRVYVIRFLSGRSALSFVHFASDRFVTVYSKFRFSISNLLLRKRSGSAGSAQDTSRQKVYVIPTLTMQEEKTDLAGREVIEVIILDPEPAEVTFVTEGKTSIRAAYTGDTVYGRMIFTPETFTIYADRCERQDRYLKEYKRKDEFR